MIKRKIYNLLFIYFGVLVLVFGQKEDHHWLIGKGINPNRLETDTLFGGSSINFNYDPVKIYHDTTHEINMSTANAIISDKLGNIIAYSNGQIIKNSENTYIEDTINYSFELPWYCNEWESANAGNAQNALPIGMITLQGVLLVNINDVYYCLYITYNSCKSFYYRLAYSKFIVNENYPTGKLLERDIVLMEDTLVSSLQAIRHGNGKDWWVLGFRRGFESMFRLSISENEIKLHNNINSGYSRITSKETFGQIVLSPDGKHLALYTLNHPLSGIGGGFCLWDFDRCSGTIQNMRNGVNKQPSIANGVAFSGDSRYLYVANGEHLWQYDTKIQNILQSRKVSAVFDSFYYEIPGPNPNKIKYYVNFNHLKLGPDGRIYIFPSSATQRYISVMDFPHENHDLVRVRQHGIYMPRLFSRTVPNIPEFRLGPDDGSSCDTLGLDNHPIAKFRYEPDSVQHKKIRFTDLSYFRPETWSWDFGDGSPQVTERYPFHTYTASGTYEVCLTVSNENSSNTTCRTVTIGTSSSDDAKLKADITLFPNPVSDMLQVTLGEYIPENGKIYIYDATGRQVLSQRLYYGHNHIDMSHLQPGLYLWTAEDDGVKIKSGKVVVNN